MKPFWIGTSGYRYWPGDVFPPKTSSAEALHLYAERLRTVELNQTFYHLPLARSVAQWKARVPPTFVWSIKLWRRITHEKRLRETEKDVQIFLSRVRPLLEPQGVLLLQLPRSFSISSRPVLNAFLKKWPCDVRLAIEFRHPDWFTTETYDFLSDLDVSLVRVSAPGVPYVTEIRTAPFAYYRMHGPREWYKDAYNEAQLQSLQRDVQKDLQHGPGYIYFDNTIGGHAYWNASTLSERLTTLSSPVPMVVP